MRLEAGVRRLCWHMYHLAKMPKRTLWCGLLQCHIALLTLFKVAAVLYIVVCCMQECLDFAAKARQIVNKREVDDHSEEIARLRRLVQNLQSGVGFAGGSAMNRSPPRDAGAVASSNMSRDTGRSSPIRGGKAVVVELEEFDED